MIPADRRPSHPGEILLYEFLEPRGISQIDLAKKMKTPVQRINTLINEKRGITAETALLLAEALNTSPELWMNLQATYDLYEAKRYLHRAA